MINLNLNKNTFFNSFNEKSSFSYSITCPNFEALILSIRNYIHTILIESFNSKDNSFEKNMILIFDQNIPLINILYDKSLIKFVSIKFLEYLFIHKFDSFIDQKREIINTKTVVNAYILSIFSILEEAFVHDRILFLFFSYLKSQGKYSSLLIATSPIQASVNTKLNSFKHAVSLPDNNSLSLNQQEIVRSEITSLLISFRTLTLNEDFFNIYYYKSLIHANGFSSIDFEILNQIDFELNLS